MADLDARYEHLFNEPRPDGSKMDASKHDPTPSWYERGVNDVGDNKERRYEVGLELITFRDWTFPRGTEEHRDGWRFFTAAMREKGKLKESIKKTKDLMKVAKLRRAEEHAMNTLG